MDEAEKQRLREKCHRDMNTFLVEIQRETDRGMALVSAAVLDTLLGETLKSYMCADISKENTKRMFDNNGGCMSSLSLRQDVCYAFGLIEKCEFDEINIIRKIRNEFAHKTYGLSFNAAEIKKHCDLLKPELPEATEDPRKIFAFSVHTLYTRLYYRAMAVGYKRAVRKQWINPETLRWKSIKDHPLPESGFAIGAGYGKLATITLRKERKPPSTTSD